MPIKIDPEFAALIPPPSPEELAQLEANMKAEGCRDALVIWKGHDILLDGHNRKVICEKLGLGFRVQHIDLPDRDAAMRWIILNQFGRRNLPPFVRAELVLKLEPLIAEKAKERQKAAGGALPQNSAEAPVETREELARIAGVSHDTIAKAKLLTANASDDTKAKLRSGETSINAAVREVHKPQIMSKAEYEAGAGPVDSRGTPLPDKQSIRTAFARLGEVKALQREVSALKGKLLEAAARPNDPIFARLDVSAVKADLEHVWQLLKAIAPFAVCPYCAGGERGSAGSCTACKGLGWLDEFNYRAAPREFK